MLKKFKETKSKNNQLYLYQTYRQYMIRVLEMFVEMY